MSPCLQLGRRFHVSACLVALVLGICAGKPASVMAGDADLVEVITSPDRNGLPVDRSFIRAVFTMRTRSWPDGQPVKVFVLPDESEAHRRFCKELLGIYPYRLRLGWDRAVFTGTGISPRTVNSVDEMEKAVQQTPGAIGYVIHIGG